MIYICARARACVCVTVCNNTHFLLSMTIPFTCSAHLHGCAWPVHHRNYNESEEPRAWPWVSVRQYWRMRVDQGVDMIWRESVRQYWRMRFDQGVDMVWREHWREIGPMGEIKNAQDFNVAHCCNHRVDWSYLNLNINLLPRLSVVTRIQNLLPTHAHAWRAMHVHTACLIIYSLGNLMPAQTQQWLVAFGECVCMHTRT